MAKSFDFCVCISLTERSWAVESGNPQKHFVPPWHQSTIISLFNSYTKKWDHFTILHQFRFPLYTSAHYSTLNGGILFLSIWQHSIMIFCSALYEGILLHSILFSFTWHILSTPWQSILLYYIWTHSIPLHVMGFFSALCHGILVHSMQFFLICSLWLYSIAGYMNTLFPSLWWYSIPISVIVFHSTLFDGILFYYVRILFCSIWWHFILLYTMVFHSTVYNIFYCALYDGILFHSK